MSEQKGFNLVRLGHLDLHNDNYTHFMQIYLLEKVICHWFSVGPKDIKNFRLLDH